MTFQRTKSFHLDLSETDSRQISSPAKIAAALKSDSVIAFDICHDTVPIGFAMFRKFAKNSYFLWNYAIGGRYQNRHYGTKALRELLLLMKEEYGAETVTTTYILGNSHAKHVYERTGFVETDAVEEDGVHEVNMKMEL